MNSGFISHECFPSENSFKKIWKRNVLKWIEDILACHTDKYGEKVFEKHSDSTGKNFI